MQYSSGSFTSQQSSISSHYNHTNRILREEGMSTRNPLIPIESGKLSSCHGGRLPGASTRLSHKISAMPDLCCIVIRRLIKSVGGVFYPCQAESLLRAEQPIDMTTTWTCSVAHFWLQHVSGLTACHQFSY